MAGRPTTYTIAAENAICEALRAGNTRKAAAEYAGISYDTLRYWELTIPIFASAIKKAAAEHEVFCVATIRDAMPAHWQAAAWWLERSRPNDYGSNLTLRADKAVDAILTALLTGDAPEGSRDTGEDADGDGSDG